MADIDILIFGEARCGKTTLANMLHERLGFPVIHKDALHTAMDNVFPFRLNEHSEAFFRLLHYYIRQNKSHDETKETVIFEGCVDPSNFGIFHPERNIVYWLGTADLSPGELLRNIRNNDMGWEWSYYMSDDDLLRWCEQSVSHCKYARESCENRFVHYVETSRDRPAVLAALADEICFRLEHGMVGNVRPEMEC